MEKSIKFFLVLVLMLPSTLFAATDCNYVELADHFEAVCLGDEKNLVAAGETKSSPAVISAKKAAANDVATTPESGQATAVKSMSSPKEGQTLPKNTANNLSARPASVQSPAVNSMLSYRANHLSRAVVDSKQAIRMKNIRMGK